VEFLRLLARHLHGFFHLSPLDWTIIFLAAVLTFLRRLLRLIMKAGDLILDFATWCLRFRRAWRRLFRRGRARKRHRRSVRATSARSSNHSSSSVEKDALTTRPEP
jgi:hypothetical protein